MRLRGPWDLEWGCGSFQPREPTSAMCLNRLGVLGHGCLFWARLPLRSIKLPEAFQSETAATKDTVKVQCTFVHGDTRSQRSS